MECAKVCEHSRSSFFTDDCHFLATICDVGLTVFGTREYFYDLPVISLLEIALEQLQCVVHFVIHTEYYYQILVVESVERQRWYVLCMPYVLPIVNENVSLRVRKCRTEGMRCRGDTEFEICLDNVQQYVLTFNRRLNTCVARCSSSDIGKAMYLDWYKKNLCTDKGEKEIWGNTAVLVTNI